MTSKQTEENIIEVSNKEIEYLDEISRILTLCGYEYTANRLQNNIKYIDKEGNVIVAVNAKAIDIQSDLRAITLTEINSELYDKLLQKQGVLIDSGIVKFKKLNTSLNIIEPNLLLNTYTSEVSNISGVGIVNEKSDPLFIFNLSSINIKIRVHSTIAATKMHFTKDILDSIYAHIKKEEDPLSGDAMGMFSEMMGGVDLMGGIDSMGGTSESKDEPTIDLSIDEKAELERMANELNL